MAACKAFLMKDAKDALNHMDLELLEDYGDGYERYGLILHTWDDGWRRLCRCRKCGGLVLKQFSEFHSVFNGDDQYEDFFPVESAEEAGMINRSNSGHAIETQFPKRYLIRDWHERSGEEAVHWSYED